MTGAALIRERVLSSIMVDGYTGCWLWRRVKGAGGYGRIQVNAMTREAHRVSYEVFKNAIPNGLVIDHLCRNKSCVNPDHLEPVTPRENTLRGITLAAANAKKTECVNGHPFDEANTRVQAKKRWCRKCSARNTRSYAARKRAKAKAEGK